MTQPREPTCAVDSIMFTWRLDIPCSPPNPNMAQALLSPLSEAEVEEANRPTPEEIEARRLHAAKDREKRLAQQRCRRRDQDQLDPLKRAQSTVRRANDRNRQLENENQKLRSLLVASGFSEAQITVWVSTPAPNQEGIRRQIKEKAQQFLRFATSFRPICKRPDEDVSIHDRMHEQIAKARDQRRFEPPRLAPASIPSPAVPVHIPGAVVDAGPSGHIPFIGTNETLAAPDPAEAFEYTYQPILHNINMEPDQGGGFCQPNDVFRLVDNLSY